MIGFLDSGNSGCISANIPHAVLVFSGEKGASKSTSMRVTRQVVDPSVQELLTMPNSMQDLALALANNYMPSFDNLDGLSADKSDLLCIASTGGGFSKRTLFTDDDETLLDLRRCVGLTGINVVVTRADLIDRSIIIELDRILEEERKEEREVWEAFEKDRARIVGGALQTLSDAMAIFPDIKLDKLPRMADFTRWGYAIAEVLGYGGEHEDDKQSRLDLLVVTNAGEWINVEIQFTNQYDMINRSIYYWAGVYRSPMKPRMGYKELHPVIAINILNFHIFDQTDRFHTMYHLYEDEEKFKLTDTMEFHFIEMSKLIRDWKAEKINPWDDLLARWLLLLGMVDHREGKVYDDIFKELEEIAMNDEILRTAFQSWEVLSGNQEDVLAYEARLKRVLDEEAAIREAELREQEARQEEKEITARLLLADGFDVKKVARLSRLNEEQVIKIQRDMGKINYSESRLDLLSFFLFRCNSITFKLCW